MDKLLSLSEILQQAHSFPWNFALFLSKGPWSLTTIGAVLNPADREDASDPEDVPRFAKLHGLRYVLMMQDLQDVIDNANEQLPNGSSEKLLEALKYYVENDAFINFSKR